MIRPSHPNVDMSFCSQSGESVLKVHKSSLTTKAEPNSNGEWCGFLLPEHTVLNVAFVLTSSSSAVASEVLNAVTVSYTNVVAFDLERDQDHDMQYYFFLLQSLFQTLALLENLL